MLLKHRGFVVLALKKHIPVAGAVFFHFKDEVILKYGASDRKFLYLRPNNLVMWEAFKYEL